MIIIFWRDFFMASINHVCRYSESLPHIPDRRVPDVWTAHCPRPQLNLTPRFVSVLYYCALRPVTALCNPNPKHSQLNALVSSISLNIDIKDQTQTENFNILDPNYSVVLLYQSRMKPCVAVQGTWSSNIYQWPRERASHQLTTNKYNIISFDSNIDGTFGSNQA